MKYEVFYGEPPFIHFLGVVDAPDDRPELALNHALEVYKGVIPEGVTLEEGMNYHLHPVVQPQ